MTKMPSEVVDIMERDLRSFDKDVKDSEVGAKTGGDRVDKVIRNSRNTWIPTEHWISGWLWYYINKANNENFCYDLTDIDGGAIQYTQYGEGQYYKWHTDADVDVFYKPQIKIASYANRKEDITTLQGEYVRKLSFVLQLSDPSDYKGGEFQMMDNSGGTFFAPKQKGTLILFDSRVRHRVRTVKEGFRKSLVGWVVGPRWK